MALKRVIIIGDGGEALVIRPQRLEGADGLQDGSWPDDYEAALRNGAGQKKWARACTGLF